MGTFSIWHWVIVLIVLGIFVGIPYIAIANTPPERRANRKEVGVAALGLIAYVFLTNLVSAARPAEEAPGVMLAVFIGGLVLNLWIARVLAARCQDIGCNRYWAMLIAVPFVNLIFIATVAVIPGRDQESGPAKVGG
jgi:uncharacterized membrane protein YhaH (DUF805 family)